jgi:small GTP-binding protein
MPIVLHSLKLLVGGDGGVGKTSIINRYVQNAFDVNVGMTIGVALHTREIEFNGEKLNLVFWDLSGQERFKFMLPNYCSGASGAFILFDMADPETLGKVPAWFQLFRSTCKKTIPALLVGAKKDLLDDDRCAQVQEAAEKWAEAFGAIGYIATSAKTGENVNEAVDTLIAALFQGA